MPGLFSNKNFATVCHLAKQSRPRISLFRRIARLSPTRFYPPALAAKPSTKNALKAFRYFQKLLGIFSPHKACIIYLWCLLPAY
jgi:hypothetical protein